VAQHPYLLPTDLTIAAGAAPDATLTSVLLVFGAAIALVIPSIGLLYTLAQRSLIEESPWPEAREERSSLADTGLEPL
jgi:cytochrome d ubiquinol oxidase subunit II